MAPKRSAPSVSSPPASPAARIPHDTPFKQTSTSTSTSNSCSNFLDPPSRKRSRTSGSPATTETVLQDTIQHCINTELQGAVLHDPTLLDKHPCDDDRFSRILSACSLFDSHQGRWRTRPGSGSETQLYDPLIKVLNAIGDAVHSLRATEGLAPGDYVPFLNKSHRKLESDYPGMNTAPDIIKCEINHEENQNLHWRDVDLFVEVKKSKKQVTEGVQQSARYARALLAHRIDRRFVKTLVVCDTTAVFLHFDRSGLVYSNDVDVFDDAKSFIRALAGLLLLSRVDAGYNPIFAGVREHPSGGPGRIQLHVGTDILVYRILSTLCHRLSIRGRATLVLALKRILQDLDPLAASQESNEPETIDAVLKLLWRDPNRFQESLILKEFVGTYGICQILADINVLINGKQDEVYPRAGLNPGPRKDMFERSDGRIDVSGALRDDARILSALLMQPGRPLKLAEDAEELKAAFVGAIMGQWALVNVHVQHRDISIHNILLPLRTQEYKSPEWDRITKLDADAYARDFQAPEWVEIFGDSHGIQYKSVQQLHWKFDPKRRFAMLKRIIELLGPVPYGFLSDVDHANILSLKREEASDLHTHRTGTLAFMATKLLLAMPGEHVPHTYLHDLESFFWVLLYVIAEHREGDARLQPAAQEVISDLNTIDRRSLGNNKNSLLTQINEGTLDVRSFATSWAISLAPLIENFAAWVSEVKGPRFNSTADPDACFEQVLGFFLPPGPEDRQDIQASAPRSGTEPSTATTSVPGA
ncbi:hypothetical protein ACGC1H_000158 [Rhizoctonia solani]|uniref:Fungal-type protein kinase domain-containing protein n=1 Tax=Rhizoctonia solani TaxID=456999 RepID=A0A8H2WPA4_9AGAM|nr:unnamed protein product [Rhizoctonia solani]